MGSDLGNPPIQNIRTQLKKKLHGHPTLAICVNALKHLSVVCLITYEKVKSENVTSTWVLDVGEGSRIGRLGKLLQFGVYLVVLFYSFISGAVDIKRRIIPSHCLTS